MEKFENDDWKVWIEDEIVYVKCLAEHYTCKMIDEGIKERREITKDKSYVMFADIRNVKSITREARQRLSQEDAGTGTIAVAFLSNSKVHEVIYNFFNVIYKAPAPTKGFTDEKKAIEWLQKYKENIRQ